MFGLLKKMFKSHNEREIEKLTLIVKEINALEEDISVLTDEELKKKAEVFLGFVDKKKQEVYPQINDLRDKMSEMTSPEEKDKIRIQIRAIKNSIFDEIIIEVFAVIREVSKRKLNMRHFDVQLIGGLVLHSGKIAEMTTGEGKTLVATLPVCLNAFLKEGVHVITVNDYLAERDMNWMRPVYEFMGFSVGVIKHDMTIKQRQQSYGCDIVYGTNNEFGFDYLRDNLVVSKDDIVQRQHSFAIVDEV